MKPDRLKKTEQVVFRLSPEDRERLETVAFFRGVKPSAILRELLHGALISAGLDVPKKDNAHERP